jgi:hypothetical protein
MPATINREMEALRYEAHRSSLPRKRLGTSDLLIFAFRAWTAFKKCLALGPCLPDERYCAVVAIPNVLQSKAYGSPIIYADAVAIVEYFIGNLRAIRSGPKEAVFGFGVVAPVAVAIV